MPDSMDETLKMDTPDYQVMGATTLQLMSFHGRIHAMMSAGNENLADAHDFVAGLLALRGIKHK